MSESAARITLSAKRLIMRIVGDVLIIETSDADELRREVNRALGDEISIRVETCGKYRKQKFGQSWSIYVHFLCAF